MNAPRAAKRGRGRPETPIQADLGPVQGILAGRVLLGYRTDPEAPSAPVIRGARRRVIYHQLHEEGYLTDEHHEAADRYLFRGNGGGGYDPTLAQVAALADLRLADAAIGPALVHDVRQVIGWNLWPERMKPEAFRDALGRVATVWGM